MWQSIADLVLTIVRIFVKKREQQEAWERAIMDAVAKFNNRPSNSSIIREAWGQIREDMRKDQQNRNFSEGE